MRSSESSTALLGCLTILFNGTALSQPTQLSALHSRSPFKSFSPVAVGDCSSPFSFSFGHILSLLEFYYLLLSLILLTGH